MLEYSRTPTATKKSFISLYGSLWCFSKVPCNEWLSSSNFGCGRHGKWGEGDRVLKGPPSVKALIIMWAALDFITLLFDRPSASLDCWLAVARSTAEEKPVTVLLWSGMERGSHLSAQACHTRRANGHGRPEERPQTPIELNPMSITQRHGHRSSQSDGPWYH